MFICVIGYLFCTCKTRIDPCLITSQGSIFTSILASSQNLDLTYIVTEHQKNKHYRGDGGWVVD